MKPTKRKNVSSLQMTAIYRRTRETRQGEAGESMLDGSRMRREARGGGGKFPNRSG